MSVIIWTTTPWTLPANQAVCLHAQLDYSLVKVVLNGSQELMLLACELVEQVMSRYQASDFEVLATTSGASLENLTLQHPFMERQVPLILGRARYY